MLLVYLRSMNRNLTIIAFVFAGLLFGASCKHEMTIPDTPAISYKNDIQPIIVSNCTQSGCHGTVNTSDFKLLTYNDVIKEGDIIAYNADNSKLFQSITGKGEEFMPQSPNSPLTDNQIKLIYWWIMQGAKDN